ncbi:MAG: UDP-N-acetylmuramate:L-alanyl-gamma-D-glutamyl-meso-diaminopimelate ligase, partial [Deltaproteobacteria bacterium]|nr:UDP-N-acetylmuramate:L-alanyl-gamma-D-glutamyl-meso-diaminopimelate ligase [Deltaproteobacteria bacterium]
MEAKSIHFVGIGGVGTGTLAVNLAQRGFKVTGSDGALYEPMKSVLTNARIELIQGYDAATASRIAADAVIIGNVITKANSEARAWIQKGTPFYSFPEAVRRFVIESRKNVVVAGTHGKTTTSTWIAYLLSELGLNPSYLIGGVPNDLPSGSAITDGLYAVCEGDEYDSAFFDKGPKFLHYHPHFLVLTSIEFDHADIYRDLDHVKQSFEKLVALLPGDGLCVARYDDPVVVEVAAESLCPVQSFGNNPSAMWRLNDVKETPEGFDFEVLYKKRSIGRFQTPLYGEHNLFNLISGIICAVNLGAPVQKIAPIVSRFTGVRRRQQVLQASPFYLIDDFAHHPTEVLATLSAVRRRHPTGKLFALFEPRSATARRSVHQEVYPKAFAPADEICVS